MSVPNSPEESTMPPRHTKVGNVMMIAGVLSSVPGAVLLVDGVRRHLEGLRAGAYGEMVRSMVSQETIWGFGMLTVGASVALVGSLLLPKLEQPEDVADGHCASPLPDTGAGLRSTVDRLDDYFGGSGSTAVPGSTLPPAQPQ